MFCTPRCFAAARIVRINFGEERITGGWMIHGHVHPGAVQILQMAAAEKVASGKRLQFANWKITMFNG